MPSHSGRVAVVTGAANGIGRASAELFAAEGGKVLAVDLDERALDWTAENDRIEALAADVSSPESNDAFVQAAVDRFGGVNALVLNAGVASSGPLEGGDLDALERCLAVNLKGVVYGVQAAIPALRTASDPAVVVTASVSGLAGDPGMWAYNASKGAVLNFVRAASLELARDGIRVNAVCPGPTRTKMTRVIEDAAPAMYEEMRRRIPLQRWGESHEVAAAIGFLCSPQASFVTGVALPVDGGVMANTGQFLPAPRTGSD